MNPPTSPAVPALRWSPEQGYDLHAPRVDAALGEGCAGFILFGGTAEAARQATTELTSRAGRPLLFGADLERGAGQQFRGATPLPPLAALGALGDLGIIREAGALTAREAASLGVRWIFAPVADLALERENPIVATRAFGNDPERVAIQVEAWIEGCLAGGAIPCVKHFPGHGRTTEDSHETLPVVGASREELEGRDLVPFRRAIEAGVPSVMTAHVAYPALDDSGAPATRSRRIVTELLRDSMGFTGVVVTDALIMEGAGEPLEAVETSLRAGVDLLLYPPEGISVPGIEQAGVRAGRLDPVAREASARRVRRLLERTRDPLPEPGWGREDDRDRALAWARRTLVYRGPPIPPSASAALTVVDDDLGGPWQPQPRTEFSETLRAAGAISAPGAALRVLCIYAEPRAWKGRAGLSTEARAAVDRWLAPWDAAASDPGLAIVFGGPRVAEELPNGLPVLTAWGGEGLMQRAAAEWLAQALRGSMA